MAFKDILLTLTSYPDPTPVSVVEEAVSIAASLGAHLAAVACEVHVEVPGHFLSGSIANVPGIIAGETEKSRKSAKDMLAAFDAAADKAGVLHETYLEKCPTFAVPDLLVDYARLRDLTIVPVPESYDQWYAEAVIFGSGRPTLVLPESRSPASVSNSEPLPSPGISAARRRGRFPMRCRCSKRRRRYASSPSPTKRSWIPSISPKSWRRTSRATVSTSCWTRSMRAADASAKFLKSYAASHQVDVLVMGAYGTARWREFILGGATKSLLSKPPLPIMFSH